MALHIYDNPGPHKTTTRTSIDGVTVPPSTHVRLLDGNDHLNLSYTDLDTLDETCRLFEEARATHIAALLDGRNEQVTVDQLGPDELAVIDGELIMVHSTIIDGDHTIVRYARKYAGLYDMTADRSIRCLRTTKVVRLLPSATLTAVR